MIRHISIRNFATIENADIDFHDGLNIITGETGAGKSIAVQAVSLALGSRADTDFIRSGKDRATVQMVADQDGEEHIITRELSSSGRNTCRINDRIVTLATLGKLCRSLADIHGQYDHQSLLDPENHIRLVDLYHKDLILPAKEAAAEVYERYSDIKGKLRKLNEQISRDRREQDFMAYELDELNAADLRAGEDDELSERADLLQNSEKIYADLSSAYDISSESEYAILPGLKNVSGLLQEVSSFSSDLGELSERLDDLYYELEDICSSIRDCRDSAVFSPEELDQVISRLELIDRLKTKHGKNIEELLAYRDDLAERLTSIDNADYEKEQLEKELASCRKELEEKCSELSDIRKESALKLQDNITKELKELNFNDALFEISFSRDDTITAEGFDKVEFLIRTNRGEPLKSLSRIASGGEMSRIMLAFKKITGDYDEIPTMIFDEIDSGISGITASIVGKKLREISKSHQIICITHLPQIAAYGDHNYKISKTSDDKMTYTSILPLTEDEKTDEIARLIGGANITETTLRSARELIESSR